jgi:GNAT superfamily N-acetyltransferase
MTRTYPEEAVSGFPQPTREVTDSEGRTILLCCPNESERLVEMYLAFDPADRAQGIPPVEESTIREWLDRITGPDTLNLVARHGDRTVGHVVFVGDTEYELAIFVLQAYQNAGIGTALLRTALGAAAATGIERVWLSVERWNNAAIALYRRVGFEAADTPEFGMEMTLRLDTTE